MTVNSPPKFNNKSVLLEVLPRTNPLKVAVAKALVSCRSNKTVCRLLNYNSHVVTLKKGLKLAKIETLDNVASIDEYKEAETITPKQKMDRKLTKTELDDFYKEYGFQICPSLEEDQRHETLVLLHQYKHVFARDVTEIKACNGPPLKIELHTHRKMVKRQFKLNDADKEVVLRQIRQLEKADVIERADSPYYNAPCFLVNKKNGQKRLVIDLRGINSLIVPKLVQLPRIEELLQTITSKKPKFLTTIDISSAFFQVKISEDSRKYTAFSDPTGIQWQFKRSPFGLATSPSQLVQIISTLFSDRTRFHSLRSYVDDLIIYTSSWKSHLEQLKLTLQTLENANISCNPRKTEIGYSEINYLGYRVSANSLRISEKRIEAIGKISAPKNVKGLQRCLGMLTYWKKHIPYYSKHTYNMRQLLKKGTPFVWSPACEAELQYIKQTLVKDPILKPLDPTKNLIISTDGSVYGMGWTVMQEDDDGNLHAVSYGACATTPAQANYSADDLEACALVYALKSIEEIAIHKRITVITDNSHLLHLNKWHPINPRQRRMLAYLMQYNLSIRFIKGSRNLLADALSRLFQDASKQERKDHEARYMHEVDDFILPVMTRSANRASLEHREYSPSGATSPEPPRSLERASPAADATDNATAMRYADDQNDGLSDPPTPPGIAEEVTDDVNLTPPDTVSENNIVDDSRLVLPTIAAEDYQTDHDFCDMYNYIQTDELTGNARIKLRC